MMEEQEKAMKQLVEYVEAVCKGSGISIIMNTCIEERTENDIITQSTSQLVLGSNGTLKRMVASALIKSNDFKELMINSFMLSEKFSTDNPTVIKLSMN